MTREEITKAAGNLSGLRYFDQSIADFAIEQVNAALEEAEIEMSEAGGPEHAKKIIRALKIT